MALLSEWNLSYQQSARRGSLIVFQGQSREGVVIKLTDGAEGFSDPDNPQPAIMLGESINESFGVFVQDLTINTGSGNLGAIGLDYQAHNLGAIRDVRIESGDGSGVAGLQLKRQGNSREFTPGPHLVKDLEVIGFDNGIVMGEAQSGITHVTFEHIYLEGQNVAGIAFSPRLHASIRGLVSNNEVPVVTTGSSFGAAFAIMDGEFFGGGSDTSAFLFADNRNQVYLMDINQSGYGSMIESLNGSVALEGQRIDHWSSHPAESLFLSPAVTIGLPVSETPEYANTNFSSDWEAVSEDFQAALDSGKPVIYLQDKGGQNSNLFPISDTLTIPSGVRWINFMDQAVSGSQWEGGANPVFRIEGDRSDPPLIIERFEWHEQRNFTGPTFYHVGSRTVVFKSAKGTYLAAAGAGDVFFEDYVGSETVFQPGQRIWARQFNTEDATNAPAPLVTNNGADLWILGHKTEGAKITNRVINGGRTEIIGGLGLPLTSGSVDGIPYFDIEEAELSAVGYTAFFTYPLHARETRSGVTREFTQTSRASIAIFSAYEESFGSWAFENGLSGIDALADGNPDSDSLNNLLEFAFNTDPLVDEGAPDLLEAKLNTEEEGTFKIVHPLTNAAVKLFYEYSSDLENWNDSSAIEGFAVEETLGIDGNGSVQVSIPANGQTKQFVRVRIEE